MLRPRHTPARRPVVTTCPSSGLAVCTHAYMTEAELARVGRRRVAFFCSACKGAHQAELGALKLA